MINKIALSDVESVQVFSTNSVTDNHAIHARFKSVTAALREEQRRAGGKQISEFADDFLYASCIMMHAAEASLIDQETGEPLKNSRGEVARGWFEKVSDMSGRESVRWVSPDGIKPYRNNNLDIFPEADLLKAYRDWVGRPLCKDHVSSSIDGVRGVIVDTFYDPKFKRVHALFALDRKNYPELARKIEAGYATNVSMGTGVGRSICTECQNVATAAPEFCRHVQTRTHYGEINQDLRPIELSIVVTGADPRAKIRKIVASLNKYRVEADEYSRLNAAGASEALALANFATRTAAAVAEDDAQFAARIAYAIDAISAASENLSAKAAGLRAIDSAMDERAEATGKSKFDAFVGLDRKISIDLVKMLRGLNNEEFQSEDREFINAMHNEYSQMSIDRATAELMPPAASGLGNGTENQQDGVLPTVNVGQDPATFDNGGTLGVSFNDAVNPGVGNPHVTVAFYAQNHKNAVAELEKMADELANKLASIKSSMDKMTSDLPGTKAGVGTETGEIMSFDALRKRAANRYAYLQGTEDPQTYPQMGDQDKIRENMDKHLDGDKLDTKSPNPDQKAKELIQRASLDERRAARADKLRAIAAGETFMHDNKPVAVKDKDGKIKAVHQNAEDGKSEEHEKDEQDAKDAGHDKAAALANRLDALKKEAAKKKKMKEEKEKAKGKGKELPAFLKGKGKAKDEKEDDKSAKSKAKSKKVAYVQGTEEPKTYPQMGDQDKIRENADKHLDGDKLDTKAPNPDLKAKELIQRASLRARLVKGASLADSRWEVLANDKKMFAVTASQAYGDMLDQPSADVSGLTWGQAFTSREYGKELLAQIRARGLSAVAADMGMPMDVPAAPAADAMPDAMPAPVVPMTDEMAPPAVDSEGDMKQRIVEALGELESCMSKLKEAVLGGDEGVANIDAPADNMATAALDRSMFDGFVGLQSLASELEHLAVDADLSRQSVRLVARAALRDAVLAKLETTELLEAYAEACSMDALDAEELSQVADEVGEAISDHDTSDASHDGTGEKLDEVKHEVDEVEDELEELASAIEEIESMLKKEDEADAYDKRAAMRQELVARAAAADAVTSDPMLHVHKSDKKKLDLGMPVADDGDVVEDAFDVHDKVMKSVQKSAAAIDAAIRGGIYAEASLDKMVAMGAADAAAVKYYREFYGKVSQDFAKGLAADFHKSASADDGEAMSMRYKRAYNLALDAQSRGVIGAGRAALDATADSLVSGSDANFEALARLVAQVRSPETRTASVIPQAGVSDDFGTKTAGDRGADQSVDIRSPSSLAKALWG